MNRYISFYYFRFIIWTTTPRAQVSGLQSIDIYVDCLSAILALKSYKVRSKLVKETVGMLNKASLTLSGDLTIRWVAAHIDGDSRYEGNRRCDEIAKKAAREGRHLVPETELPGRTLASVKREIHF